MKADESGSHRSLLGTWSAMMKDSRANIRLKSISICDMETSHINITITLNLCRIVVLKGLLYLVEIREIYFSLALKWLNAYKLSFFLTH